MGKTTITITPALRKKLKDTALKVRQDFAKEATKQISDEAQKSIEAFYNHYNPARYKRKYGFLKKSYKSAYKNPGHGTIYGGVRITAEGNKQNYIYFEQDGNGKFSATPVEKSYEVTGEWNVSNSNPVESQAKTIGQMTDLIYSGHHGYTEIFRHMFREAHNGLEPNFREPPVMSPSPYERIKQKREEFVKEFCNNQNATEFAKKYW